MLTLRFRRLLPTRSGAIAHGNRLRGRRMSAGTIRQVKKQRARHGVRFTLLPMGVDILSGCPLGCAGWIFKTLMARVRCIITVLSRIAGSMAFVLLTARSAGRAVRVPRPMCKTQRMTVARRRLTLTRSCAVTLRCSQVRHSAMTAVIRSRGRKKVALCACRLMGSVQAKGAGPISASVSSTAGTASGSAMDRSRVSVAWAKSAPCPSTPMSLGLVRQIRLLKRSVLWVSKWVRSTGLMCAGPSIPLCLLSLRKRKRKPATSAACLPR